MLAGNQNGPEIGCAVKIWTLPSANGNVGITKNGENYVLTPANGAPFTIPVNNLNTLVVPNGISLSGTADVLKTGPSITGAVTTFKDFDTKGPS